MDNDIGEKNTREIENGNAQSIGDNSENGKQIQSKNNQCYKGNTCMGNFEFQ